MKSELPIRHLESALIRAVRPGSRTIVRAPTGSGKSTQIPQMLLDGGAAGDRQIVVLQPRRIAARLLAARVARERGASLGGEVGYQVRFERVVGPDTRIRYITEGLLLRQQIAQPDLPEASILVFDEFHERHLDADLSLARALRLQETTRPDLRLVVMSATLDVDPLRRFLGEGETLLSEGRTFPVSIEYLARAPSEPEGIWTPAADAAARLAEEEREGDLLIFLPGAYEISRACQALRDRPALRGFSILPLHGDLPLAAQEAALAPSPAERKVVVATNVAETSLTIEGVRAVIDGGQARVARYDPRRGLNSLRIERISRASADQRAGRAGRLAPGRCVRLWTEQDQAGRPLSETPEIRRVELSEAVLLLKAGGTDDLAALRWLDPPDPLSLKRALLLLSDLGALDTAGRLTPIGRRMAVFPAHPRLSRMLLAAGETGCVYQAALVAALMQGRGLLLRRADRGTRDRRDDALGEKAPSDFFRLMRAWSAARAARFDPRRCQSLGIHGQAARQVGVALAHFLRLARGARLPIATAAPPDEVFQKTLLAAFPDHLARRLDGGTLRCELVHNRKGALDRESAARHASLFVAAEIAEIEGREVRVALSLATEVREEWLDELFPGEVREQVAVEWDKTARRVTARTGRVFRGLVLRSRPLDPPPREIAGRAVAEAVLRGDLRLSDWADQAEPWIERVRFLARACPDLGIPDFDGAARERAIRALCENAVSYREIKERNALAAARSVLTPRQARDVDRHAPERLTLPTGARVRIVYSPDGPPRLTAKIQDLYGLTEAPRVAGNRVPLTVDILGPNFRSVQITGDLARFWSETYPELKKTLQRKYPGHEWR